jgi:hypothetical protein
VVLFICRVINPQSQSEPVHYTISHHTPYQQYNKWRHIHYSDTPIAFHTITADTPTYISINIVILITSQSI